MATKEQRWSKTFRIRVAPETFERAKRLAREQESSVSQIARRALTTYLAQQERNR